jgi:LPS-assembly lipoprotein
VKANANLVAARTCLQIKYKIVRTFCQLRPSIDRRPATCLLLVLLWTGQSLLVAGCGFHLRSVARMPDNLERTHIAGLSHYSDFYVALDRALRANGVAVVNADRATAILRIIDLDHGRRVLSVGADGSAREYELFTRLKFEIAGQGNRLEAESQTITVTRDFLFDNANILGKTEEAELLYEDMQKELVRLMLYRMQAAG